ncbi:MAG TPA: hypothetical protein VIL86_13800 [Tepidisphaeraceae bacterium]|jgi:hypothetical protein
MPLDYATAPPVRPRIALRFWLIGVGGGAAGFLFWCLLHLICVRLRLSHDLDWLILLMLLAPVAVGLIAANTLRRPDSSARVGLTILAVLVASVLSIALIVMFGLSFHFAIGGEL